jgi:hypothetical protein
VLHQVVHKPISEEENIGLSCNVLGEAKKNACGLGQSGCIVSDAVLELDGESVDGVILTQLICCREGIGEVGHDYCSFL